jgi:S-(hydroxymethyl)glutathione dehydrogenase/alcohol dehydrogenase
VKTKGALLWEVDQKWSVEEIEIGDPRQGEVTIQLEAAGLCHSDHHLVTGDTLPGSYPVLGGHEGAGIVTNIGPGVSGLQVGDHVVLSFTGPCGQCWMCTSGHPNLCDNNAELLSGKSISDGTARIQARGKDVVPMCLLGTFAPYVIAHQSQVVKIDESIPLELAALVGCGVTTGWGSAVNVAKVQAGETVVIVGVGGVGINALQGAVASGARRVIAIDPVEGKRAFAEKLGATMTFASMEDALEPLAQLTWGHMADKVIICVGRIGGEHIAPALALTRKAGRCVVVGMGSMTDMDVKLNLFLLTNFQQELKGAMYGGSNPRYDLPKLLGMYQDGRLNLDDLVTQRYRLEEINEAYADMLDGKNIRGVIIYSDADRP